MTNAHPIGCTCYTCTAVSNENIDEVPYALTDQHAAALERAIRAEGYDIAVDIETSTIKLVRTSAAEDIQKGPSE
jgi:hypothetical protein